MFWFEVRSSAPTTIPAMRIEIHPGEGGDDAATFALELGRALAKFSDGNMTREGRIVVVESPVRL